MTSTFKIATWNVNSLRVRLPHLLTWLGDNKPDVLALQEIKLVDADFPLDAIQQAGYVAIFSGQKTYNGVAILMRKETAQHRTENIVTDFPAFVDPQRRVLALTVNDLRIINLYVPNGQSVGSEKYQYKLAWLKSLTEFLQQELTTHKKIAVMGDFNIAPHAIDVHDPAQWDGQVLVSQPERDAFQGLLSLGFGDCFRTLQPEAKTWSWWDYRMNAFKRNMGLRIDHILASHALLPACIQCDIDSAPRALERPSDHAPVIAHFAF